MQADYCVAALPLPLLAQIDTDFPADFKATIAKVPYAAAGKMGMQFKRRFWEEDDQIFGGASKTDMEIGQIVYPSAGYLGQKGVLLGYYLQGQAGRPIGDKTPAERLALAMEQGGPHPSAVSQGIRERVLGRVAPRHLEQGVVVQPEPGRPPRAVGAAGPGLSGGRPSELNAWMQGAFESARHTATAVHARAAAERATARV